MIPLPVGTNCWTKTEDRIAAFLPALSSFQALTQQDEAGAASHVLFYEIGQPEHQELIWERVPNGFAIVSSPEDEPYALDLNPSSKRYDSSGVVAITLVQKVYSQLLEATQARAALRTFKNLAGNIVEELAEAWIVDQGSPLPTRIWCPFDAVLDHLDQQRAVIEPDEATWPAQCAVEVHVAYGEQTR